MISYYNKLLFLLCTSCMWGHHALLAQNPSPGNTVEKVAISGATFHIGDGTVQIGGSLLMDGGKIVSLLTASEAMPKGYEVIEASNQHVYPGFIACNTTLGLVEVNAVRATNDIEEVGSMNPNARALIAYNTDSEVIPTVRSNGVLLAQVTPGSGWMSGKSSVMKLDGWNWEDAALKIDDGLHLDYPNPYAYDRKLGRRASNPNYQDEVRSLGQFFEEAAAYCRSSKDLAVNVRLAALCGVLQGEQRLYVHVDHALAIEDVVQWLAPYDVEMVIVGGTESWRVANLLKEKSIPVILTSTQKLPFRKDEAVDQPFRTPAILHAAGVKFAISDEGFWQQRNLPFQAGQAIGYGLPPEIAIASITGNAADVLGIGATTGTLQKGKDATVIISTGDVLDMRHSQISHAWIQGKRVDLNNKQKQLYEKFSAKYKQ